VTKTGTNQAPVEVSILATKRAWISVKSDGKTVESVTLDPDKPEMRSRSYKAEEKLMLVVGNPAGLTVTYNGKPIAGPGGTSGDDYVYSAGDGEAVGRGLRDRKWPRGDRGLCFG
jgi:hypothetical protein